MSPESLLEAHKTIRLKQGYRWGRNVLSIIRGGTVHLYDTLAQSYFEFLSLEAISKRPIIQEDAALQKLESLSLVTCLTKVEEDAKYFAGLRELQHKSTVSNYTIAPTLDCNCRCPYCFVQKGAVSMSDKDADSLAAYISEQHRISNKPAAITWYGGEPLLAIKTIHRISRFLLDHKIPFSADIVTNGLLINDETTLILRESRVSGAQITLDGCRSNHNKTRNVPGNPYDTYSAAIAAASRLTAEGFHLKIRVNCSSENIADIHKLATCPRLSALDKSRFVLYIETIDTAPQVHAKLEPMRELFIKAGYRIFDGLPQASIFFYSCSALRNSDLCIGPKLELYDCYSDLGNKNRAAGVLNPQLPPKSVYTDPSLLPAACGGCPALPFCYARGCPYKLARGNFIHDETFCLEFKRRTNSILLKKLTDKYGH